MFSILDGRTEFFQWDQDRKIVVADKSISKVHFANSVSGAAIVRNVYECNGLYIADVPNILLQKNFRINVYGYDANYTKYEAKFNVVARAKPDDYIYTEEELNTLAQLEERIDILEQGGGGSGGAALYCEIDEETLICNKNATEIKEAANAGMLPVLRLNPDGVEILFYYYASTEDRAVFIGYMGTQLMTCSIGLDGSFEGNGDELLTASNCETILKNKGFVVNSSLGSFYTREQVDALIANFQTADEVQSMIDTSLGVIENGTY